MLAVGVRQQPECQRVGVTSMRPFAVICDIEDVEQEGCGIHWNSPTTAFIPVSVWERGWLPRAVIISTVGNVMRLVVAESMVVHAESRMDDAAIIDGHA